MLSARMFMKTGMGYKCRCQVIILVTDIMAGPIKLDSFLPQYGLNDTSLPLKHSTRPTFIISGHPAGTPSLPITPKIWNSNHSSLNKWWVTLLQPDLNHCSQRILHSCGLLPLVPTFSCNEEQLLLQVEQFFTHVAVVPTSWLSLFLQVRESKQNY